MKNLNNISFFIILISLLYSCKENKNEKQDIWKDTKEIQFLGENITLKLPKEFKRSSRYVIKNDIPNLESDSLKLVTIQNALRDLEFEDNEIDVFVDTSHNYRYLIMMNTIKLPKFNKDIGNQLKRLLNEHNRAYEKQNFGIKITELDTKYAGNTSMKMLKFKYKYEYRFHEGVLFRTVYAVSQNGQTIIVHEYSETEDEVGQYLWSYKN